MNEERVTISLLNWLEKNGWEIICYDFPQSGTGVMIHPNIKTDSSSKNKGGIIPDIIAAKDSVALFFENKNRFYLPDFEKLKEVKESKNYSDGINALLTKHSIERLCYGVGLPNIEKEIGKAQEHLFYIDFLVTVNLDERIEIYYDKFDVLITDR